MKLFSGVMLVNRNYAGGQYSTDFRVTALLGPDKESVLALLLAQCQEMYPADHGFIGHRVDVIEVPSTLLVRALEGE